MNKQGGVGDLCGKARRRMRSERATEGDYENLFSLYGDQQCLIFHLGLLSIEMTVQCNNYCICTSYRPNDYQPQYSKALLHVVQLNKVPESLPHLQSLILLLKVFKLL